MSPILEAKNLSLRFNNTSDVRGVDNVSFSVVAGEVVCVLGASGSGKSTLLRLLAGVELPQSGLVSGYQAAFVPQEYTLWPHLTVMKNLTLAPMLQGSEAEGEIRARAEELLHRFDLADFADNYPTELSGGQRQRVALLRAIMVKPKVLLLDEVTSALDPELTKSVLDLIRALAKDGYAMVIVTHHMSFAMSVADRVLFMKNGRVVQGATSVNFFTQQTDPEIRRFIAEIAKRDDSVEIFKGKEQYQAYHLGLIKRLPENSTIHIAGAVGDAWYAPMEEFYAQYEKIRLRKNITWKMVTYDQGDTDRRLMGEHPALNHFRKMPRNIKNPANYNVFGDTVITQIFEDEPTIIQIKNPSVAEAYLRFFEELWEMSC